MVVKRGDIYYADLRPVVGSEQGGVRPVLIIQNDMGNRHCTEFRRLWHRKRFCNFAGTSENN